MIGHCPGVTGIFFFSSGAENRMYKLSSCDSCLILNLSSTLLLSVSHLFDEMSHPRIIMVLRITIHAFRRCGCFGANLRNCF